MINIDIVIYGYLFICISLLIYNFLYMFQSTHKKNKLRKMSHKWLIELTKQCDLLDHNKSIEHAHLTMMETKLKKTQELLAYLDAIEIISQQRDIMKYLTQVSHVQQSLAYVYSKKDSMNRAFFAYVISQYPSGSKDEFRPIMEILLSYLDNSTVYCRENVLHALCALGNIKSIESALQIMNDNGWFHHQKLLSDGLATFQGDREALLKQLWTHYNEWDENIMLSVVQCITLCSDQYNEIFLPLLKSHQTSLEIRLAILRYYRHHIYEPVRETLYAFFNQSDEIDENLLVVAAFVLECYPGEQTVAILKKALCHHNWYIRQNAAYSLVNMDIDCHLLDDIWNGDDRYAKDMLNYVSYKKAGEHS